MRDDDWLRDWSADEPPEGFADRVLAARAAERAVAPATAGQGPGARRRRPALIGATILAAAAVAAGVLLWRGGSDAVAREGVVVAGERTSTKLAARGVAVAEAGSELRWRVDPDGDARIEQKAGDVFYRVERGGSFVVVTDAGEVHVRGTCFRVEFPEGATRSTEEDSVSKLDKIRQGAVGAAIGALAATAVVVTVYEGRVDVRGSGGSVTAGAGEKVVMAPGEAPQRELAVAGLSVAEAAALAQPPATDATREQLLARDAAQRERMVALEQRLRELASAPGQGGPGGRGRPGGDSPAKMFDFTPEELREMAKSCEIRFDLPPFGLEAPQFGPKMAEEAHLSEAERQQMNQLLTKSNQTFLDRLRGLYVEATGDKDGAMTLDVGGMLAEVERKQGDLADAARQRIAQERAGLVPAPADPNSGTVSERYYRMLIGTSDELERSAAGILGPERARAFREMASGRRSIMNGCPDQADSP